MSETQIKEINIQYYAILREACGLNEEVVSTAVTTLSEVYEELRGRHNFKLSQSALKVAVNNEFCDWQTKINSRDNIVFIPPVAGG